MLNGHAKHKASADVSGLRPANHSKPQITMSLKRGVPNTRPQAPVEAPEDDVVEIISSEDEDGDLPPLPDANGSLEAVSLL